MVRCILLESYTSQDRRPEKKGGSQMFKSVIVILAFAVATTASMGAPMLEFACGGAFIACSPNNVEIELGIDNSKNPAIYNANGIKLESFVIPGDPKPPNSDHDFGFAFDTSSFDQVEDLTFANDPANKADPNAEDLRGLKITDLMTMKQDNGLIELTFDIQYPKIPADYAKFLGGPVADGSVTVDYDPNAMNQGVQFNGITDVQVLIGATTPEPRTFLMVGSALLLVAGLRLRRRTCIPAR